MTRFRGIILSASIILIAYSQPGLADGWEVDNIWWNLIINFKNTGMTRCIAENYNMKTVTAVFDVYPEGNNANRPVHAQTPVVLPYHQQNLRVAGWPDNTKPAPQCKLISWH